MIRPSQTLRGRVPAFIMLALAVLFFALAATGRAQPSGQYTLEARLDPEQAMVGDTVLYILSIVYTGADPPQPTLPTADADRMGLTQWESAGTQRRQSIQMVNGRTTAVKAVEFRYTFVPSKEGTLILPSSVINVGSEQYRSNSVSLTVAKAPPAPTLPPALQGRVVDPLVSGEPGIQRALRGAVFIVPTIQPESVYAGQQVLVSHHLYIDLDALSKAGLSNSLGLRNADIPEMAQFVKETVFDLPRQLSMREQTLGGRRFAVAPLHQVAAIPTKAGELTIEPFRLELMVRDGRRNTTSGDPFGMFGNDPFFSGTMLGGGWVTVIASSPATTLDVKPLPEDGKPANFGGAVGNFKISAALDKQNGVAADDIVKLSVKIEGQGDAASLSDPNLVVPAGMKLLEAPRSTTARRVENNQLVSSKTFDFLLRANQPGHAEIPAVSYTVFNPATVQYEQIQSVPLALDVGPSKNPQSALTAGSAPEKATQPADDATTITNGDAMRYIREGRLETIRPGFATAQGPLFWLLLVLPPLLVAGVFGLSQVQSRKTRRPVAATASARGRLRQARGVMNESSAGEFYETLAAALRGYIGDRFQAGVTPTLEEVSYELEHHGANEEAVTRTRALLERCDARQYAPGAADPSAMKADLDEATRLLQNMEALK